MSPSTELVQTPYGNFHAFTGDLITHQLKTYGAHTRNELAMLLSFVHEGDVIVDVGAHIGTFSIPMAKATGKSGKVFSFEASPSTFAVLQKNIAENKANVTAHNSAISHDQKSVTIAVEDNKNSGANRISTEKTSSTSSSAITAVKLDDIIHDQINMLKIDVEGMEWSVLQSAKSLIKNSKPLIYIEINASAMKRYNTTLSALESYFKSLGYDFFRNEGQRNSSNDDFVLCKHPGFRLRSSMSDYILIPRNSDRYPKTYVTWLTCKELHKKVLRKAKTLFSK